MDTVGACVGFRVLHRVRVQLDADHLVRVPAGDHADGADAAVGVQERPLSMQARQLHRLGVKLFRLFREHLVKGACRDPEAESAEHVLDVPFPEQHLFPFPQHHAGALVVDVLNHRGDLRAFLPQRVHEIPAARKDLGRRHDDDHDLARGPGRPHHDVADQAEAGVLVKGFQPEGYKQVPHDVDDAVCPAVLDETAVDVDNAVGLLLVHARDHLPVPEAEGRRHLVPVVERIIRPGDGLYFAEALQKPPHLPLLHAELLRIGDLRILAAAAFLPVGAVRLLCRRRFLRRHRLLRRCGFLRRHSLLRR